jgi:hypothetical protein
VAANTADELRFVVEPRLLDHFGVGMYNTVEKALAELVANSYDADATRVSVTVSKTNIVVRDNGVGMSADQVRDYYLRIGRDRRADTSLGEMSPLGRAVIGTKGIGKLAGLGIAATMKLVTTREGQRTTLTIDRQELDARSSLQDVDLGAKVTRVRTAKPGTEIRLVGLLPGMPPIDVDALREHLATELPSVPGFDIYVNQKKATAEDISGERFPIDGDIPGYGHVGGFYKVVDKRSKSVAPGLAVRVRDRIVQPRSLFGLNQQTHGYFAVTRIVGELWPDFIDPLENRKAEDAFAINTSRTALNPESPKVLALNAFALHLLSNVADGISKKRKQTRKEAAYRRNPGLEERMQRLPPEVYAKLDEAIDKFVEILVRNEKHETIDQIIDLVIKYYESSALRSLVESIKNDSDADVERVAALLAQFGSQRIFDIANSLWLQLAVIASLEDKVAAGALEAEIHTIIATNVWLVRDSLQYWYDNKAFATQLGDALADNFKWAKKQRADLVCLDNHKIGGEGGQAERLVVIEFKRPGVEISYEQLAQIMGYKEVFLGSLPQFSLNDIEVWILATKFGKGYDREALAGSGYHLLSYVELLQRARGRYRDFYERLVPDGNAPPHPDIVDAADVAGDEDDEAEVGGLTEPGVSEPD